MGLGKTLLALTEFLSAAKDKQLTRLVVICPNTFKGGWAKEIHKHHLACLVHVYEAARHKRAEAFLEDGFNLPPILILNYEALPLLKTEKLIADYCAGRPCMLVIDESIKIKTPTSARTKATLRIAKHFRRIRLLSGKPMTQGAHDLWAQMKLIGATEMGFHAWRGRFCEMGGWEGRQILDVKNAHELQAIMAPFTYTATKKQWLSSLPPKGYRTVSYALSAALNLHYREMEDLFMTWLDQQQSEEVMVEIALTKLMKLQQIGAGFIIDNDGTTRWLVRDEDNPRLQALLDTLEGTDAKVCITYWHKPVGLQLQRVLRHLTPALIAGNMKPEDIDAEVTFFNTDPRCRAILLQGEAAKYGHTLIGSPDDPCFTMLFFENFWSLDTRAQLEDRIHRLGQSEGCLYVDFAGTDIDEKYTTALQRKERVFEAIFGFKTRGAAAGDASHSGPGLSPSRASLA